MFLTLFSRAQAHMLQLWDKRGPTTYFRFTACRGNVLRTDIVLLKPNTEQEKRLFRLATESSLLWNQANYERRQAFFKHKNMPSYAKQCNTLKHSSVLQLSSAIMGWIFLSSQ